LDSTSNYRTFKAGPLDPGEVEIEMIYNSTNTTMKRLHVDLNALTSRTWTIDYPSTTAVNDTFTGTISALGAELPLDDVITRTITIKLSGKPGLST
jgi:hypothetical protein